jgi:hypothetical protein
VHLDQYLAGFGLRPRRVFVPHRFRSAEGMDADSFHGGPSGLARGIRLQFRLRAHDFSPLPVFTVPFMIKRVIL